MKTMKAVLFLMPILAIMLGFGVSTHAEIYYPWCANYSGGESGGGGSNCGFSTYEQCMATVSGIGGFCDPNPFYTPPSQKPTRRLHKKDRRMENAPSGGYSSGGYSFWGTPGNPAD